MIRIATVAAAILIIGGAAFFFGMRWDDASDANARAETLERAQNADKSKGNADDDRSWVVDFVDGLLSGN